MSALALALLLSGAAAAHCGHCGAGAGEGHGGGVKGANRRHVAPERKGARRSSAYIPRDEGSKVYESPPGEEAAPPMPEAPAGSPPAALSAEDAAENMRTVLETRLARTGGLWKVRDNRTGKPRGLALQGLRDAKDEGEGRWSARATFQDKAGAVQARVLVDLSGARWRLLKLEPAAPPAAASKTAPSR